MEVRVHGVHQTEVAQQCCNRWCCKTAHRTSFISKSQRVHGPGSLVLTLRQWFSHLNFLVFTKIFLSTVITYAPAHAQSPRSRRAPSYSQVLFKALILLVNLLCKRHCPNNNPNKTLINPTPTLINPNSTNQIGVFSLVQEQGSLGTRLLCSCPPDVKGRLRFGGILLQRLLRSGNLRFATLKSNIMNQESTTSNSATFSDDMSMAEVSAWLKKQEIPEYCNFSWHLLLCHFPPCV